MLVGETNLVFQGGGVRGLAYLGALEELHRRGIRCHAASGTSVGGLAAAIAATSPRSEFLTALVNEVGADGFLTKRVFVEAEPHRVKGIPAAVGALLRSLCGELIPSERHRERAQDILSVALSGARYTLDAYQRWVERTLRASLGIPARRQGAVRFDEVARPLAVYATDLANRNLVVWSSKDTPRASVAAALACSAAAWPVFLPRTVEVHNAPVNVTPMLRSSTSSNDSAAPVSPELADGGWLANLPLESLVRLDPERAFASLAFRLRSDDREPPANDLLRWLLSLITMVIEGGEKLELARHPALRSIVIQCGDVLSFDPSIGAPAVRGLIVAGRQAVESEVDLTMPASRVRSAGATGSRATRAHTLVQLGASIAAAERDVLVTLPSGAAGTPALGSLVAIVPWIESRFADESPSPRVRVLIDGDPDEIRKRDERIGTLKVAAALGIEVRSANVPLHAIVCDGEDWDVGSILVRDLLDDRPSDSADPLLDFRQLIRLDRSSSRRLFEFVRKGIEEVYDTATPLATPSRPNPDGGERFRWSDVLTHVEPDAMISTVKRAWIKAGLPRRGVSLAMTELRHEAPNAADVLYARSRDLETWRLVRAGVIAKICRQLRIPFGKPHRLRGTNRVSVPPIVVRFGDGKQLVIRGRHRLWYAINYPLEVRESSPVCEIHLGTRSRLPTAAFPWRHLECTFGRHAMASQDEWSGFIQTMADELRKLGERLDRERANAL